MKKTLTALTLLGAMVASADIVLENSRLKLTLGDDAAVKSLVTKATGEELLDTKDNTPFIMVTQPRPFNNEIKLSWMNARTTYAANSLKYANGKLTVGFDIAPYRALVAVKITEDYIAFTLEDFLLDERSYPVCPTTTRPLDFTAPPVDEFRICQLPVKNRERYGMWLNVLWDDSASVAVVATSPHASCTAEKRNGYRLLAADAHREVKLRGTGAALVVDKGGKAILDRVDAIERDYGLPRGVQNRRNPLVNASIYFANWMNLNTVDEHIRLAKLGGFKMMEMSYGNIFGASGDYEYNDSFPNGPKDVKKLLDKIRAAGLTPGLHILHTFISPESKLVKGGADHRLQLREHYTLARDLGKDDTEAYVDENPQNAEIMANCKILKFGKELIKYEGFTLKPPYKFYGLKRGYASTPISAHEEGLIGGTLWVCEYGGWDYYLKQDSDLQDVISKKVSELWKCGFGFVYFDGSEGVCAPFYYHVPNAQYRMWKNFQPQPILGEGAAKAHFGWHMLSGANAFDVFFPEEFKVKIAEHPLVEAPHMANDFTRVNFGWWGCWAPSEKIRGKSTIGTQADMWEFGTSRAAAYDSPVSVQIVAIGNDGRLGFAQFPRHRDILETMRRWEDVRAKRWLTAEQKEMLKSPTQEHHLYLNERGEYELLPIEMLTADKPGLRAFVFERNGKRVVAYWHTSGAAEFDLGELGKVNAADRQYLVTDLSVAQIKAIFKEYK